MQSIHAEAEHANVTRVRALQASPQEKVGIGAYFKRSQPPDGDGLEVKVGGGRAAAAVCCYMHQRAAQRGPAAMTPAKPHFPCLSLPVEEKTRKRMIETDRQTETNRLALVQCCFCLTLCSVSRRGHPWLLAPSLYQTITQSVPPATRYTDNKADARFDAPVVPQKFPGRADQANRCRRLHRRS